MDEHRGVDSASFCPHGERSRLSIMPVRHRPCSCLLGHLGGKPPLARPTTLPCGHAFGLTELAWRPPRADRELAEGADYCRYHRTPCSPSELIPTDPRSKTRRAAPRMAPSRSSWVETPRMDAGLSPRLRRGEGGGFAAAERKTQQRHAVTPRLARGSGEIATKCLVPGCRVVRFR